MNLEPLNQSIFKDRNIGSLTPIGEGLKWTISKRAPILGIG